MANDILQRFLTARLFSVGGDESRLGLLRDAAADLAVTLGKAPERVAAFTTVAIDPDVAPDEPLLLVAAEHLQARWNSYVGAFADTVLPVLFRAIILQALETLSASEANVTAIALTARNYLPYRGASIDQSIWQELLAGADAKLEARARKAWSIGVAKELQPLALPEIGALTAPKVGRDWMKKRFEVAVGPSNAAGEALEGANPYWPNDATNWAYQFPQRAATAVGGVVDPAFEALVKQLNAQAAPQALVEAIQTYVVDALGQAAQGAVVVERRSALLWWKESLYSVRAESSYRELAAEVATAFAAVDASGTTGAYAPRMAEAFLVETIRAFLPDALEPRPLLDQANAVSAFVGTETAQAGALADTLGKIHLEPGRTLLGSILGRGLVLDGDAFERRVGLARDTVISPAHFALWLFRDVQIAASTPAKRKK